MIVVSRSCRESFPHSGSVGLLLCDWPATGAGDDWRDRALGVPAGDLNRNGFVGGSLAARLVVVDFFRRRREIEEARVVHLLAADRRLRMICGRCRHGC